MFKAKINRVSTIFLVIVLLATFVNPFPASACLERDAKKASAKVEKAKEDCKNAAEKVEEKNHQLYKTNVYVAVAALAYCGAVGTGNLFQIAGAWAVLAAAVSEQVLAQQAYDQAKWELDFKNQNLQILLERWRKIMAELQKLEQQIFNLKQEISSLESQISDLKEEVKKEKDEQGGSPGSEASNKIAELEAKLEKKEAELKAAVAEHSC